MAKSATVYECENCGAQRPKWSGQCSDCGKWNTLVETVVIPSKSGKKLSTPHLGKPLMLSQVQVRPGNTSRVSTGMGEFDRVLGGGIVAGSVVLLAGHPGIGKSTILTQLALSMGQVGTVLYVCGEESPEQVKLRVDRLPASKQLDIRLLPSVDVDEIVATVESMDQLSLVIVDSIQSLSSEELTGMAGSVGQVRESTNRLIRTAKTQQVPVFLVGHVTKEGSIAGPKVLEHMVDVVLELSGERTGAFRIMRTIKNRFGATDEVGVFAMGDAGMREVTNPSEAFLEESQVGTPGSVVVALMEGTRPILVEIQALVVSSQLAMPRRVTRGVNLNKIQLLAAVLQKRCNLSGLGTSDIFVNVAGGIDVVEPAADLGVALAIASSLLGKPIGKKVVVFGEVGLLGEIRKVAFLDKRIKEAQKLGYMDIIAPDKFRNLREVVKKALQ